MPREPSRSVERARRELPPDERFAIDRGELPVREPPGFYHGTVALRAGGLRQRFVEELASAW